jgi:hypothetical protein
MGSSVIIAAEKATFGTEEHFGETRRELRLMREVMRVARSLWPQKTAAELAFRTGVSQRTAENWLSLSTGISGPALSALIASEEGIHFIEASILAQGKGLPVFWRRFKKRQETSQMKRDIRQLQMRLEKREADEDAGA